VIDAAKGWLSKIKVAYTIGAIGAVITSGALGHCSALMRVGPRVEAVEHDLGELRGEVIALGNEAAADRKILWRLDGMITAIASHLGVRPKEREHD